MKQLIKLLLWANILVAFSTVSLIAHNHRYEALPFVGCVMAIGGMYNLCKDKKHEDDSAFLRRAGGVLLLLSGMYIIITSNEIIDSYDAYMKNRRWEMGCPKLKDIF